MGEISDLRFTVEIRLLKLRLQGFELGLHGMQGATAGQSELRRRIFRLQPLLQGLLPPKAMKAQESDPWQLPSGR